MKLNVLIFGFFSLLTIFTQPIFSQTKRTDKLINKAKKEMSICNYLEAIIQLNRILEKQEINTDALYLRGICLDSLKRNVEAIQDYNKVITLSSNSEAYRNRANLRYKNGNYYRAIIDYEKFINFNSQNSEVFFHLASSYGYVGNLTKAIKYYSEAIKIDTNYAFAYANRGFSKFLLGDFFGSIEDYDKAILINPDKNLFTNRGNIKAQMKNYEGAILDQTEAIELINSDNDSLQFYNRGSFKLLNEDCYGAIDDLNIAIKLNPYNADYFGQRGLAKQLLMNFQDAIDDYTSAISINPNHYYSYNNRGNSFFELKKMDSACSDWKKALEFSSLLDNDQEITRMFGWSPEKVQKLVTAICK